MERVEVAIIGAGMAGLRCAAICEEAGLEVAVLERDAVVGGRVATDVIDGYHCDRGFQLLNPAYPALRRAVDLAALDLRAFQPGVSLALAERTVVLADPRRAPQQAWSTLRNLPGPPRSQLRLAQLLWRVAAFNPSRWSTAPDCSTAEAFARAGVTGPIYDQLLKPFLQGVLLDPELGVSFRVTQLILRSMVRGTPAVPANAMAALPRALAAKLRPETVRLGHEVLRVRPDGVDHTAGHLAARAVVVATEASAASALVPGVPALAVGSVATTWLSAPATAVAGRLFLDPSSNPGMNLAPLSVVAPNYAPPGRLLVAASTAGTAGRAEDARTVAARLLGLERSEVDVVMHHEVPEALPLLRAPLRLAPPLEVGGIFLAGDHRSTPSLQGALASGERVGRALRSQFGR